MPTVPRTVVKCTTRVTPRDLATVTTSGQRGRRVHSSGLCGRACWGRAGTGDVGSDMHGVEGRWIKQGDQGRTLVRLVADHDRAASAADRHCQEAAQLLEGAVALVFTMRGHLAVEPWEKYVVELETLR